MPIPLLPLDDRLFHLLYAREDPMLAQAAYAFSAMGSGWALLAIAPLAAMKRTRRFTTWLVATLLGTAVIVAGVKELVARGRPCTVYAPLRAAIVDSPTDCSFPSGHAAGSFCFAAFVAYALVMRSPRPPYAWAAAAACVAFASCVALSRVVLGFHFPADVAAGAVIGGTIGALAARRMGATAQL